MPVYFSQRNLTDRHSVYHSQHYTKFRKKVNALLYFIETLSFQGVSFYDTPYED